MRHTGPNSRAPPDGQLRGISDEEAKERDDLVEAGFGHWQRRDYLAYLRALPRYVPVLLRLCSLSFVFSLYSLDSRVLLRIR